MIFLNDNTEYIHVAEYPWFFFFLQVGPLTWLLTLRNTFVGFVLNLVFTRFCLDIVFQEFLFLRWLDDGQFRPVSLTVRLYNKSRLVYR